jgi:hypothetical protein
MYGGYTSLDFGYMSIVRQRRLITVDLQNSTSLHASRSDLAAGTSLGLREKTQTPTSTRKDTHMLYPVSHLRLGIVRPKGSSRVGQYVTIGNTPFRSMNVEA